MSASFGALSRTRILDTASSLRRWILLVLVAGVPLFFLRFTNDPFEVPKLGFLTAGVALAVGLRTIEWIQGSRSKPSIQPALVAASFILVPLSLAWAFGPYRYWSLMGEYRRFQGLLPYLVVIILGVLVTEEFGDRLRDLCWAFVLGGGVVAAYALAQFVGIDPFDWRTVAGGETTRTSTVGNPNFTGGYLAITTPIAFAMWRAGGEHSRFALRALVLVIAGQVVSVSQGGYGATVAGLAICLGIIMEGRWSKARTVGFVVALLTAVFVAGVVVFAMARPDSAGVPTTIQNRALWWQGAIAMGMDHPLTGRGPNAYAVEGVQHRPLRDSIENGIDIADDVHSVPLSFLTSAGLPGILSFLALFVLAGRRIWYLDRNDLLRAGLAGAVVAYLVQSLVSIDQVTLRVSFWAALGGLIAVGSPSRPATETPRRRGRDRQSSKTEPVRKPILVVGVVVLALVPLWWSSGFIWSDRSVWKGSLAFLQGDPVLGSDLFENALSFRDEYAYRHFYGVYLGATAEQMDLDSADLIDEMDRAYAYLDHFPSLFGFRDYAGALYKLGEESPGLTGRAAELYLRALELDPFNYNLMGEAAPALVDGCKGEELIEVLEPKIGALEERVPELWAYLAAAYDDVDRRDDALDALGRAETLTPGSVALARAKEAIESSDC